MGERAQRFVISLGGSLIVPHDIDVSFLERFNETILTLVDQGFSFIVIPGGGSTARRYQSALRSFGVADTTVLDEVGISALTLNARVLKALFGEHSPGEIIFDGAKIPEAPVVIAAHARPGRSSDAGAVELAQQTGLLCVVNLSNIAYVYREDPRENPNAEQVKDITWSHYQSLIPSQWSSGMSAPFDPVASKMAQEAHLTVAIIEGHDTETFTEFVRHGVLPRGTLIHP
jgi:uridylate kinase